MTFVCALERSERPGAKRCHGATCGSPFLMLRAGQVSFELDGASGD